MPVDRTLSCANNDATAERVASLTPTIFLKQTAVALQQSNTILEAMVQVRTAELQAANAALQARITEHEATKLALRHSDERYRVLAEMMPDALFVSRGNRLVYVNPAFLRLLGATIAEQVLGKTPFDFFHPASHKLMEERIEHLLMQDGPLSLDELKITRLDGVAIDVETTAALYPDQPNDTIQVILRDMTARKQTPGQHAALLAQLAAQRQQLQLLNQKVVTMQENERKHLARELHDQVGQDLTALAIHIQLLREHVSRQLPAEPKLAKNLDDALALVTQVNATIRNVTSELQAPPLNEFGLLTILQWYCQDLARRVNLKIEVAGEEPTPKLTESIALALFRIAQEALTNVVKHAGATQVTVRLWAEGEWIYLTVDDNGCGFDPTQLIRSGQAAPWGILGMKERVMSVGGELTIESYPRQGTIVQVTLCRFPRV